jgi:LacI family transcriptional regulator
MRTSLKDIAKELNISKTTVSWVLSGQAKQKGISEATANKVIDYAMKLNYQPNLIARSLNTGETKTIGLIIPSISDSFYSEVAREIEAEARECGYSLMISSSESDINREDDIIRVFKSKRVDGIIVAPTKRSIVEIQRLIDESHPLVTIDRYFPELNASYVIINNRDSSYMLTKHLVNKGCKKIVILTTNPHLTTMNQRREGFEDALRESGISINPDLYGEVNFVHYERNIYKVLDDIFKNVPDVDGFFFTTHILALEAFQYFNDKGIKPDFEFACIHEAPVFKILAPRINVARMPIEEIGKNAVSLLIEQIDVAKQNKKGRKRSVETKHLIFSCSLEFRS